MSRTAPLSRPLPRTTHDSREFWSFTAQGKLVLRQCRKCNLSFHYPRIFCPRCTSDDLSWQAATGRGTVYAFSIVHRAPDAAFRDDVPYVVALIELEEGVRMLSNVTHCDVGSVSIGMPVEVWFEPTSEDLQLPKFRPAAA